MSSRFWQFLVGAIRGMSISTFPWLKVLVGLVLMSMLLLVSSCFLPLGRSAENPSWFHQIALGTLGLSAGGNYVIPELRELCDQYGPPVDDDFVVGGYAYSPFELKRTMGKFEATPEMTTKVKFDCFPCIQELLVDGYPYIEVFYVSGKDVKNVWEMAPLLGGSSLGGQDGYVTETGWYRYSLADRKVNPELCGLYDYVANSIGDAPNRSKEERRAVRKAKASRNRILSFRKTMMDAGNKCIAIEKISAPTARYLVENFSVVVQEIDALIGHGLILRQASIVTDRSNGKVLASQNRFSYWHRGDRSGRKLNSRQSYRRVSSCGAQVGFLDTRVIVHP